MSFFTCFEIRVVYFEMAYGLDVDFFFRVYYRFTNRRGISLVVFSDNGINFVGVINEL